MKNYKNELLKRGFEITEISQIKQQNPLSEMENPPLSERIHIKVQVHEEWYDLVNEAFKNRDKIINSLYERIYNRIYRK